MKFSIRNSWLAVLLFAGTAAVHGQTIREQVLDPVEHSAGSSMSYRFEPQTYTPAPEGYEPFYISHFGRHGSRYHTTENIYRKFYDIFAAAAANNALTPFGMEVKQRVDTIFAVSTGMRACSRRPASGNTVKSPPGCTATIPKCFSRRASGGKCRFSRARPRSVG